MSHHASARPNVCLRVVVMLVIFCMLAPNLRAQSATATLSGTVEDERGAVIPSASVTVTNTATGLERQVTTNNEGYFTIPLLPPSTYSVMVQREGFQAIRIPDVILNVNDQRSLQIQLKVGQVSGETVQVDADPTLIDESPAVGTVVDRQFVENLPMNGRSFQSLFRITPGVVITKTAEAKEQGQFSVNGQRADTNYFTVDGVSANIGVSPSGNPSQATGGALPGFSASGGTNNLVSIDALQEFQIQTSTFAPEFGRTPGGQISIVTRSGTNRFSGTLFEYFRNDVLDANDWFANANRLPKPAERQNDFGGVLGGPIIKNKTFFFFSYEGLRLRQPQVGLTEVPTLAARQALPQQIQPYVNAFPLPNGPVVRNGVAQFNASFSNPSSLDATSIRIDHALNSKLTLFGRYNHAPSEASQRGSNGAQALNVVVLTQTKTQTLTLGSMWSPTSSMSNDFRFNYSRNLGGLSFLLDDFGGGALPPDSLLFPSQFASPEDSNFAFILGGVSRAFYQKGINARNLQRQINAVDNLLLVKGSHQLKFGVDYRRLSPIIGLRKYAQLIQTTQAAAQAGNASFAFIEGNIFGINLIFTNLSLYGQDTWKATRRLALTYGLRWELNPAPSESNGNDPIAVTGVDNLATLAMAPRGTSLYQTTSNNFAPRVGIAYQLSQRQGRETVVRGGFGIFYDLGSSTAGSVASSGAAPYGSSKFLFGVPLPLDAVRAAPPPLSLAPPFSNVYTTDPNLKLPRVYQFNVAVEQALGNKQTLTASYVGAVGRRLLNNETIQNPNPAFALIHITRNTAKSDYNALQLQFQRRLSRGIQALASYTWSHSIDTVSNDLGVNTPSQRIDPNMDRGSSDFDVRHSFTAAVTYNMPTPINNQLGKAILGNWAIDSIVTARTALPVNVTTNRDLGFGSFPIRPDLVSGVPLYLDDPSVGGGRRINPAAFVIQTTNRQGTLGRNALRGFPLTQVDLALRRQFKLTERVGLQFRAEFFNIFNHPNFADPDGNLGSVIGGVFTPNNQFGRSTQMLGRGLGAGGGFAGGFNPLYQIGGPRSIQLALKLQF